MKIHSTHSHYGEALSRVIATLPDGGRSAFTVERSEPKSDDLPPNTQSIYSIEDTTVDIAEVVTDGKTDFVVLEYGLEPPSAS